MNISIFSPTFVWDTRNCLIQITTLAVPLFVEGLHLSFKIFRNPHCLKDGFLKLKACTIKVFTKNSDEKRLVKTITSVSLGALLMIGSGSLAYFLAPPTFSIAAAVITIQVFGEMWNGIGKLPPLLKKVNNYLKDAFHQKNDEPVALFRQRQLKAIRNIIGCTLIFTTSLAVLTGAVFLGTLFANAKNVWQLSQLLPFQSPLVVFLEYATLGAAHTALAVHEWRKGNQAATLFHTISGVAALAFPIFYILEGSVVRLHHSFIGLALQLLPWRPVQCLGSVITFDSILNSFSEMHGVIRGEVVESWKGKIVNQYDYQNALLENLPFAVTSMSLLCLLSRCLDYFTAEQTALKTSVLTT